MGLGLAAALALGLPPPLPPTAGAAWALVNTVIYLLTLPASWCSLEALPLVPWRRESAPRAAQASTARCPTGGNARRALLSIYKTADSIGSR